MCRGEGVCLSKIGIKGCGLDKEKGEKRKRREKKKEIARCIHWSVCVEVDLHFQITE